MEKQTSKYTKEQIYSIVKNITEGNIHRDELLKFVEHFYYSKTDFVSLYYLTDAMAKSGDFLDLAELDKTCDKHSTGGVSDTTTIIIVPICACLGTKMLKLSGKALSHTGGTADKLLEFKNYNVELSIKEAIKQTKKIGGCIISSSASIAPADKIMYDFRHKNNLVDSIALISSSIMSKKIASGAKVIVLDVKYGNGAFMTTKKAARKLGKTMKKLGKMFNRVVHIHLSDMNQPLGNAIGTKLEVMESISVLNGKTKNNLYHEAVKIASICVSKTNNICTKKAKKQVELAIKNKTALNKLKEIVKAQNGELDLFDEIFPKPNYVITAKANGKIKSINTKALGLIVAKMQQSKNADANTYGIKVNFKLNQKIQKGQKLFEVFYPDHSFASDLYNTICLK